MELFDSSIDVMQRAQQLRSINQRVIAGNIANVDTPGYTAQKMDFDASMARALEDLEAPIQPVLEPSEAPPQTLDGNNVNMEGEISAMQQNKMMYTLTNQLLASKFRQLSTVLDSSA